MLATKEKGRTEEVRLWLMMRGEEGSDERGGGTVIRRLRERWGGGVSVDGQSERVKVGEEKCSK